jgi:hypothetical protein
MNGRPSQVRGTRFEVRGSWVWVRGHGVEGGENYGWRFWSGQGGSGLFDDLWRGAGVWSLGEFGCGEEFGVATGAVARAQEVEETLLADGDGASFRLRVAGCRLDSRVLGGDVGRC